MDRSQIDNAKAALKTATLNFFPPLRFNYRRFKSFANGFFFQAEGHIGCPCKRKRVLSYFLYCTKPMSTIYGSISTYLALS